jgi:hypothetical protein
MNGEYGRCRFAPVIQAECLARGENGVDAIRAVVDWLADTTAMPARIAATGSV